jgi:hypothetical protein
MIRRPQTTSTSVKVPLPVSTIGMLAKIRATSLPSVSRHGAVELLPGSARHRGQRIGKIICPPGTCSSETNAQAPGVKTSMKLFE